MNSSDIIRHRQESSLTPNNLQLFGIRISSHQRIYHSAQDNICFKRQNCTKLLNIHPLFQSNRLRSPLLLLQFFSIRLLLWSPVADSSSSFSSWLSNSLTLRQRETAAFLLARIVRCTPLASITLIFRTSVTL
jgi:hypothetical protein